MPPLIRVTLFGSLTIESPERLEFGPYATGLLFACLALSLERPLAREELIALIWPSVEDEQVGRHRLRQALYGLRQQLSSSLPPETPLFLTTKTTVQLNPALIQTDVAMFKIAIQAAAQTPKVEDKERLLTEAIQLYQGELLPGFFLDALVAERERLKINLLGALHERAILCEKREDFTQGIALAQRAVSLDPLLEEAHCDLMRLYAALDQPSNLLRQYRELEQALTKIPGGEPSPSSRALLESLRRRHIPLPSPSTPPIIQLPNETSSPQEVPLPKGRGRTHQSWLPRGAFGVVGMSVCLIAVLAGIIVLILANTRRSSSQPKIQLDSEIERQRSVLHLKKVVQLPAWIHRFPRKPSDRDSEPTAVVTDSAGNAYVTGMVNTQTHDVDFLTLKYDPQGNLLWEARYNGPGNDVDRARGVAVGPDGSVYVIGESDNGKGNDTTRLSGLDIVVLKYDKDGHRLWEQRFNGEKNGEDKPVCLLLDPNGSVFVLGSSWSPRSSSPNGGFDLVLLKYDKQGKREWAQRYSGPGDIEYAPTGMVRDPDGSLYLVSSARTGMAGNSEKDVVILKYTTMGRRLWTQRYGAGNHADDQPRAIGLDRGGNIYVLAEGLGAPGTLDAARPGAITIKYRPDGELLWARGTVLETDRITWLSAAAVSPSGDTFLSGQGRDAEGQFVYRTVKRDAQGQLVWVATHESINTASVMAEDAPAALIPNNDVTIVGTMFAGTPTFSNESKTEHDLLTLHYDAAGSLAILGQFDAHHLGDYGRGVAVDSMNHILVVGQSDSGMGKDIVVLQYHQ